MSWYLITTCIDGGFAKALSYERRHSLMYAFFVHYAHGVTHSTALYQSLWLSVLNFGVVRDIFLLQRGRFCGIIMLCIAYNER